MMIFNSRKESGNIFYILGEVCKLMRKQRRIIEYSNMLEEVENSDSYEEALKVIGQHVTLIDEATGRIYGNEQFGRTV